MSKVIRTRKGLDIKLAGQAEKTLHNPVCRHFALKPTDFNGVFPKLLVAPGDSVKAGTPIFYDKYREDIKFCSPVSGTVKEIKRGPKRILEEILIEADGKQEYEMLQVSDPAHLSREEITKLLLESGTWPMIRQRPYSVIANPADEPKAIHVSGFDSAPLAPDYGFILAEREKDFLEGLKVLGKLSGGKVHLNLRSDQKEPAFMGNAQGVEVNRFSGPHPAGNVGVQIHHIDPINKGDIVWYVNPQDVAAIGSLFLNGHFDPTRTYALTGSELKQAAYARSYIGVQAAELCGNIFADGPVRMISGNVLTGDKISKDGYMGFYHHHFTAIPEGKHYEFLGWALPGLKKFSVSRTFFSWLAPGKEYRLDTNLHGGHRAYVVTGEYDRVVPMDILPVQLVKAIMVEDIDLMENLGIYEVDEEDLALCEVICTSKTDVQEIVRKGLDLMRKEMS